jgi:hypothetical protein
MTSEGSLFHRSVAMANADTGEMFCVAHQSGSLAGHYGIERALGAEWKCLSTQTALFSRVEESAI